MEKCENHGKSKQLEGLSELDDVKEIPAVKEVPAVRDESDVDELANLVNRNKSFFSFLAFFLSSTLSTTLIL